MFELDLLRALVMVADCGSFTTAATRLHSTQSTVSQKVRRLEELAGHRLLERGHRCGARADADQRDAVGRNIVLGEEVTDEEVGRGARRGDPDLLALDGLRARRIEGGILAAGHHQAGVAREQYEGHHVLAPGSYTHLTL
ncbi:LysR family transcriptional regulator, partial [Streptomyces albiflaviniger]|nr:LysR family transcriptional regulator [Streptomyces albiflaviniger]